VPPSHQNTIFTRCSEFLRAQDPERWIIEDYESAPSQANEKGPHYYHYLEIEMQHHLRPCDGSATEICCHGPEIPTLLLGHAELRALAMPPGMPQAALVGDATAAPKVHQPHQYGKDKNQKHNADDSQDHFLMLSTLAIIRQQEARHADTALVLTAVAVLRTMLNHRSSRDLPLLTELCDDHVGNWAVRIMYRTLCSGDTYKGTMPAVIQLLCGKRAL